MEKHLPCRGGKKAGGCSSDRVSWCSDFRVFLAPDSSSKRPNFTNFKAGDLSPKKVSKFEKREPFSHVATVAPLTISFFCGFCFFVFPEDMESMDKSR